jgi:hypothetical protein
MFVRGMYFQATRILKSNGIAYPSGASYGWALD